MGSNSNPRIKDFLGLALYIVVPELKQEWQPIIDCIVNMLIKINIINVLIDINIIAIIGIL